MITSKTIKAFTLIELLVVIAIIGILSGVVIVSMSNIQESAKDSRIKSEMNQLRTVVEIYKASHSGDYTGLTSDSQVSALLEDISTQGGTADSNLFTSSNSFCVFSLLASSDESWCIDSLGYSGIGTCTNYQCNYDESSWSGGTLAEGLVGYWTMDQSDSSGSTLFDQSPYGNDGTIYGATFATDRMGQPNKAMRFDGVDDYIDCGNGLSNTNQEEVSFGAWINFNEIGSNYFEIINKGNRNGNYGIEIAITATGGGLLRTVIGDFTNIVITKYDVSSYKNQWIHVFSTYDNASSKLYLNGILVDTKDSIGNIYLTDKIYLGSFRSSFNFFNGSIDDVRIYNRALSASEIQQLYQAE